MFRDLQKFELRLVVGLWLAVAAASVLTLTVTPRASAAVIGIGIVAVVSTVLMFADKIGKGEK